MKRSGIISQCIALIILVVAFILFWNFSERTPFVVGGLILDAAAADAYSVLPENLFRMIPILLGSILFGVAIAFYVEEGLAATSWKYRIIARQIAILASIPSLLYGLLGLYFFVFKTEKDSLFTHAVPIVLLVMPITIQSTQKAIREVDISVREAAYALGASRWRVIVDHVFPHAFSTIMAGIWTAISRALAIAAFIIVVFIWKIHTPHSEGSFSIPSNVFVLLASALLCSVLSTIFEKKTYNAA